jgi:hypothetical protein
MHIIKNRLSKFFLILIFLTGFKAIYSQKLSQSYPYYSDGISILGYNKNLYNNRPLYCDNSNTFILTGDKPLIRLVEGGFINGSFLLYYVRNDQAKWMGDFSDVISGYQANKMTWNISDKSFKNLKIQLEVVPLKNAKGMALSFEVKGSKEGDQLIWVYGGIEYRKNKNLSRDFDIVGHPELEGWKFDPLAAENNIVSIREDHLLIKPSEKILKISGHDISVVGTFPSSSVMGEKDSRSFLNTQRFDQTNEKKFPVGSGKIIMSKSSAHYYWAFEIKHDSTSSKYYTTSGEAWNESNLYADQLSNRVVVHTPDNRLNALASISSSVINALWYDSVYVHGAMLYNIPYPGWRVLYGGTVYGWHDRMNKEAEYYISSQILTSDKLEAKADTGFLLMTTQNKDSRFYGVGRIAKDQNFYNFQSVFFDQLISEWRSTGDSLLEKQLWKALGLHSKWQKDCFDPDGDGLYESYINSWPTDSQWYNGGGSAEETSYAYKVHMAMRDMALHLKEGQAFTFHNTMAEKIKQAFLNKLWIKSKGHSGSYLEQGGFQRLHTDPWLYSIFLPIDAGLVNKQEEIRSLYYTTSTLQNDKMPLGGRQVWESNWVPGIWSIRQPYGGDNYHLALAYFLSGIGEEGWDIFKGAFLETAFNGMVPGNLGSISGVDFADCAHMFSRALVEGLFGYRPDYPNGRITVSPAFPDDWDSASIIIPDYSLKFKNENNKASYNISITRSGNIDLFLPLLFEQITNVTINGKSVKWKLLPGVEKSIIYLALEAGSTFNVVVSGKIKKNIIKRSLIIKNIGDALNIKLNDAKILSIGDDEGILKSYKINGQSLSAVINNNTGNHTLIVNALRNGITPQMDVYHFKITDKVHEMQVASKSVQRIPKNAKWNYVDISYQVNADVRTIYQQKYLTPRPNTVSVRIGTDGYSPWTFPYWKNKPPEIKLDSILIFKKGFDSLVKTKPGVPFLWPKNNNKNIAFTSLWDNWPHTIKIPVNKNGTAIYLLICGSTNPMQCNIANAVIHLNYSDGSRDSILLIPPINYWNLSPINALPSEPGQPSRDDYMSITDTFCLPKILPQTVQLGKNCRAMILNRRIIKGKKLASIDMTTLSQEVVVGIMGITIMD